MAFPNGSCATAATIAIPSVTTLDITGGSGDPSSPCPSCAYDCDERHYVAWYTFTATDTSRVRMHTDDSTLAGEDTLLVVYSGSCGSLVEVACSEDDSGVSGFYSTVTFDTEVGVTYYVMISNYYASDSGSYVLTATAEVIGPPYAIVYGKYNISCVTSTGLVLWTYVPFDDLGLASVSNTSVAVSGTKVLIGTLLVADPDVIVYALDVTTGAVLGTISVDAGWPVSSYWDIQLFTLPSGNVAFRATGQYGTAVNAIIGEIDIDDYSYTWRELTGETHYWPINVGYPNGYARCVVIDDVLYYLYRTPGAVAIPYTFYPTHIRAISLTSGTSGTDVFDLSTVPRGTITGSGRSFSLDVTLDGDLLLTCVCDAYVTGGSLDTSYVQRITTGGTVLSTWTYPFADVLPTQIRCISDTEAIVIDGDYPGGGETPRLLTLSLVDGTLSESVPINDVGYNLGIWDSYSFDLVPASDTEIALSGSAMTAGIGTMTPWMIAPCSGTSSPVLSGTAVATDATPDPARFGHYKAGRRRP